MRLNLGCGRDHKTGYVNVDFNQPCDLLFDLSNFPWPWSNESCDEILMLDFLEHFSYRKTEDILHECWRILKENGSLIVQVPDFEHCSNAILDCGEFLCNCCGNNNKNFVIKDGIKRCNKCCVSFSKIAEAAMKRLYGGQDYVGNWHFTSFTKDMLVRKLKEYGFDDFNFLEKDHQYANWNFKVQCFKKKDLWG